MPSPNLLSLALALPALSGFAGLLCRRGGRAAAAVPAGLMAGGALAGLAAAARALSGATTHPALFPWPPGSPGAMALDPLGAFFLVPIMVIGFLGSLYQLGYWPPARHPGSSRTLPVFWGLLTSGMTLLAVAKHALVFLLGWEIMALSAFFMIAADDHRRESRQAAWLYLIATHVGTLTLFFLFTLWRRATGSYALEPLAEGALSPGLLNSLFFLALLAFGLKAGVIPLHFWLPAAHANAPSHVSALLSGVVIKIGVFGLVRFLSLVPAPPTGWGSLILALGALSALLGVVFALAQHDLKRLLAYHSIENIGIIFMGLGVALLGRSAGRPEWVALGLAGCLLHVWNHGFFKGLLFLCAGSVLHGAHSRQLDRLGGLARTMPWTAALFLVGAAAICGLPPLNGFVSEWLVYLGLLNTALDASPSLLASAAIPLLAMVGALALACFIKVYGAVFLGVPRTAAGARAREAPLSMRLPMLGLAAACVTIGLAPFLVGPLLDRVAAAWCPELDLAAHPLRFLGPLPAISLSAGLLLALAAGLALLLRILRPRQPSSRGVTWDCGYARPTPRMQYTASSFAQFINGLFAWILRPRLARPRLSGLFPARAAFHVHVDDPVLDRLLRPGGSLFGSAAGWFRRFQHGLIQHYVLYVLLTLILMLGTLIPVKAILLRLFSR